MSDITKSCSNCAFHYQFGSRCGARPCHQGDKWVLSKESDYIDQIKKLTARNKELEDSIAQYLEIQAALNSVIDYERNYSPAYDPVIKHFQDDTQDDDPMDNGRKMFQD